MIEPKQVGQCNIDPHTSYCETHQYPATRCEFSPTFESSAERTLTIGLDFDDTWTADPDFWAAFIVMAQDRGHRVVCVTCRRSTPENEALLSEVPVLVLMTNLGSKLEHMKRAGISVDVWIDDDPACILNGK